MFFNEFTESAVSQIVLPERVCTTLTDNAFHLCLYNVSGNVIINVFMVLFRHLTQCQGKSLSHTDMGQDEFTFYHI